MPVFEFLVEGPPKTANAKNKARYQNWIEFVRAAAKRQWPADQLPLDPLVAFTVEVVNYYRVTSDRPNPPDVDNILKPILDALKGVVYPDDIQVERVVSGRHDLADSPIGPPLILEGLARFREFLHVRVRWEASENDNHTSGS